MQVPRELEGRLPLFDLKISMLIAALTNVRGREYLDFTAVVRDKRFRKAFHVHPILQAFWKIVGPQYTDLRLYQVTLPSTSGGGAANLVVDCKLLRRALTACPSPDNLPKHWPIERCCSGLPRNVKAALRFALGNPPAWPANIRNIPLDDSLLMINDPMTGKRKPLLDLSTKISVFKVDPGHMDEYFAKESSCVANRSKGESPLDCVHVGVHGSYFGNWEAILRAGLGHGHIKAWRGQELSSTSRVYMSCKHGNDASDEDFREAMQHCKGPDPLQTKPNQGRFTNLFGHVDVPGECLTWTVPKRRAFQSKFGEQPECIGIVRMVFSQTHPTKGHARYVDNPNHALLEYLVIRDGEQLPRREWQQMARHLIEDIEDEIKTQYTPKL